MRLPLHAWKSALHKLGPKAKSKSRTKASRRPLLESLEIRQMFWGQPLPAHPAPNIAVCPSCACSPIDIGANGAAITTAESIANAASVLASPNPNNVAQLLSDVYPIYNSGLNPHYIIRFDTSEELQGSIQQAKNKDIGHDGTYMSATLQFGPIGYAPVYYKLPSDSSEVDSFAFEVDASDLATGRYNWTVKFKFYKEDGTPLSDDISSDDWVHPHTYVGVQDIINRKTTDVGGGSQGELERPNPFGDGWSLPDLDRVYFQAASGTQPAGALLVTGDNRCIWFPGDFSAALPTQPEPNPFAFPQAILGSVATGEGFVIDPDTTLDSYLAINNQDGTRSLFGLDGLLRARVDQHGDVIRAYKYGDGETTNFDDIISIKDNLNNVTQEFSYSGGMVIGVTSVYSPTDSQTVVYQYDSTGHLTSVTDPDPDGSGPLTSPYTQFGYDSANGLMTSEIDARGLETDVQYDSTRQVKQITQRCGGTILITSIPWKLVVVPDPDGGLGSDNDPATLVKASCAFEYDNVYGNTLKIFRNREGNPTSIEDALGNITTYTYALEDDAGGIGMTEGLLASVAQTNPDGSGSSLVTDYAYDETYLTGILNPDNSTQSWDYASVSTDDGTLKLLQSSSDGVNTTYYTYYADHTLKSIQTTDPAGYTYFSYTSATSAFPGGLVENVTDADGNITHYEYSGYRVISITQAYGTALAATTQYQYDDRGNITAVTDPLGDVTQYFYDNLNRVIEKIGADPDGDGPKGTPTWFYAYDQNGNQISVTDPLANTTQYTYDVRDRAAQVIQPIADPATIADPVDPSSTVISDAGGTRSFTFAADADTPYQVLVRWLSPYGDTYDSHAVWEVKNSSGVVLASLPVDLNQPTQGSSDGNEQWQSLGAYSASDGQLTVVLVQSGGDFTGFAAADAKLVQVGPVTQYEYDCASNLIHTTDPLGNKTTYVYDADNRLLQTIQPVADPAATPTRTVGPVTQYVYNKLGWLTSMTDPNGNITAYVYDDMGNATEQLQLTDPGLSGTYQDTYGGPTLTRVDNAIDIAASSASIPQTIWTGAVNISSAGPVTFTLNFIGSATLQIDGVTWIGNYSNSDMTDDVPHTLNLAAGWHSITLQYGSDGSEDASDNVSGLRLSYKIGDDDQITVPVSALSQCTLSTAQYFDALGRPNTVTDPMGVVTQYNYNAFGQTTTIIQDGLYNVTSYDSVGNAVNQRDPKGNSTQYVYDNLNHLVQTIQPIADPNADRYATEQTKSLSNNDGATTGTWNDNNVASANGATATFTFGSLDDAQKYEVLVKWINNSSDLTAYDSNAIFRIYAGSNTSAPLLATWSVNLNAAPDSNSSLPLFPAKNLGAYLPQGSSLTLQISDGNATGVLTIDSVVVVQVGPVTSYTYDVNGNRTSLTDPDGNTTQWRYDGLNRVIEQVDALGHHTYYSYDAVGNLTRQIDSDGRITLYTYDNLYRQTSETWQQETTAPEVVGRYLFYNDSLFDHSTAGPSEFDDDAIAPDKQVLLPGETADSSKFFDSGWGINGLMIDIANLPKDEDGHFTISAEDFEFKVGNTSDPSTWDSLESTPDVSERAQAGKDRSDRVTLIWNPQDIMNEWLQVTVLANGDTGLSTPDVFYFGNLMGDMDGNFSVDNGSDFLKWQEAYLAGETQDKTSTTDLNHDGIIDNGDDFLCWEQGYLTGVTLLQFTAPATTLRTISYTYDADSRLKTVTDPEGADYSYTYDNLGDLLSTTSTLAGLTPTVTLDQSFDDNGNRTQLAASIGGTADFVNGYQYDALNLLTRLTQVQSDGNTVAAKLINFTYNADGQFTSISRYAGTNLVASSAFGYYEGSQLLKSLTHTLSGSTDPISYTWTYNEDSQVTQMVSGDGTVNYTYDRSGQLLTAGDTDYAYDANGNRTNEGYTTGANNRLMSDGVYNYTYDNDGNLVKRTAISDDSFTVFGWDYRNRLVSVKDYNSSDVLTHEVTFTYDAFDRVVSETIDPDGAGSASPTTEYSIYDGSRAVLKLNGDGNVRERLLWEDQVDKLLADETATDGVFWILPDNQGTTRDIVQYNPSGSTTSVASHVAFDAFGNILSQTSGAPVTTLVYAGLVWDSAIGQYRSDTRLYDAKIGRWTQPDWISFNGGDTNLGRYLENSPTNGVDPRGMEPPYGYREGYLDDGYWESYDRNGNRLLWNEGGVLYYRRKLDERPTIDMSQIRPGWPTSPDTPSTDANGVPYVTGGHFFGLLSPEPLLGGLGGGCGRSAAARSQFLRSLAEDYRTPSWMKSWLGKGKVPPGYEVDHIIPLSIGGPDTPANMRLQGTDLHRLWHKRYHPWTE